MGCSQSRAPLPHADTDSGVNEPLARKGTFSLRPGRAPPPLPDSFGDWRSGLQHRGESHTAPDATHKNVAVLHLQIVQAEGLLKADRLTDSDPFITVRMKGAGRGRIAGLLNGLLTCTHVACRACLLVSLARARQGGRRGATSGRRSSPPTAAAPAWRRGAVTAR
jgi:hypothetical protein